MSVKIVLVKSKYPRNVGMVARAMANFGPNELVLVAPQCELDHEAREGAAQGQGPLRNCRIYPTWAEYIANEDDGPRVAFSRRQGKRRQSMALAELTSWSEFSRPEGLSLIFGAEDHGLSSEDLEVAHRLCHFELPGELHSMNLSHAVVHVLGEIYRTPLRSRSGPRSGSSSTANNEDANQNEPIQLPDEALRGWLESLNFDLSQQRWNAFVALKQMIMKSAPTEKEIKLLNSIIQQTMRRLKTSEKEPNS